MYYSRNQQVQNMWDQYLRSDSMNLILESEHNLGEVWLGNIDAAKNVELLKSKHITSVLSVAARTGLRYSSKDVPNHLIVPAEDVSYFDLQKSFDQMADFLDSARHSGNVLVHCFAGISRSSSALIAYMINKLEYSFHDALHHCKQRRSIVDPNPGFTKQLLQYEKSTKQRKDQELRAKSRQLSPYSGGNESRLLYGQRTDLLSQSTYLNSHAHYGQPLHSLGAHDPAPAKSENENRFDSSYLYQTPKKKSTLETKSSNNTPANYDEQRLNERYEQYLSQKFNLKQGISQTPQKSQVIASASLQQQQPLQQPSQQLQQPAQQQSSISYSPLLRPSSAYGQGSGTQNYLEKYNYLRSASPNKSENSLKLGTTSQNFYSPQKQEPTLNYHYKNQSSFDIGSKYNIKPYQLNTPVTASSYIKSISYSDNKPKLHLQKEENQDQDRPDHGDVPKRPLQVSNSNYSQNAYLVKNNPSVNSQPYNLTKNLYSIGTSTSHNFYQYGARSQSTNPYSRQYINRL